MCVVGAGTDGSGQTGAGGEGQQALDSAGDEGQPVLGLSPSTGARCGKALLGAATLHYLALRLYVTPGIGSVVERDCGAGVKTGEGVGSVGGRRVAMPIDVLQQN